MGGRALDSPMELSGAHDVGLIKGTGVLDKLVDADFKFSNCDKLKAARSSPLMPLVLSNSLESSKFWSVAVMTEFRCLLLDNDVKWLANWRWPFSNDVWPASISISSSLLCVWSRSSSLISSSSSSSSIGSGSDSASLLERDKSRALSSEAT